MTNNYEDYCCLQTGKSCDRGSTDQCPQSVANVVTWCKWFVHKSQCEVSYVKQGD